MDNIVVDIMLAALTLLVIYTNIEDYKRRARMTPAERKAEREFEAEHKTKWKS